MSELLAGKLVMLEVLPVDNKETCSFYYTTSKEECEDPALARFQDQPRCPNHILLALRKVARNEESEAAVD